MGYTHYWRRLPVIDLNTFACVQRDLYSLLAVLAGLGVALAGPLGEGEPVFSLEELGFNGTRERAVRSGGC